MARGIRFKKYSRRTSRARNSSRVWLAVLIVAVFLVLCLLISVIIGLVLGKKAESQAQKPKLDVAVDTYYSGERQVKRVDAFIYDWDFNISNIWRDEIDFSVCLQESDGSLAYDPGLGITLDGIAFGEKSLAEHVGYIKDYGGHVSAYLYVRTFDTDDEYLRNIICDFEIALVNKAASSGVNDILLVLPKITDSNIDDIEKYVSDMSKASPMSAVGVLLPSELYRLTESDVYHASRLRAVCDFAALDLREATEENIETVLTETEYYISSYSLRAVFCSENSKIADLARELGVTSLQIIKD